MFKWFIALLIAASIFSSPVKQSSSLNDDLNNNSTIYINFAKGAARNILITTNNVIEILIRNIDRSTRTVVPQEEKIDMQNL